MTLGANLRRLREKANLSQLEAAKGIGITNAQLSRYELDERKPDPEMLTRLADFYSVKLGRKVSIDYLLGRVDNVEVVLTNEERALYDAIGNTPNDKLRELFDFEDANEEDIDDILKQVELIKIRRRHTKSR